MKNHIANRIVLGIIFASIIYGIALNGRDAIGCTQQYLYTR